LLAIATLITWFPTIIRHGLSQGRTTDPRLVDTALAFGATPRRARRSARRGGVGIGAMLLVAVLAGTSLTPALILCPASDLRPIGPAVLDALSDPPRAAALAILVLVARLLAFALAGSRWTPPRLWLYQG
jgi:hypothetical protein